MRRIELMSRRALALSAVLAFVATPAVAGEDVPPVGEISRPDFATLERVTVVEVVDGDTVRIRRGQVVSSVILLGVDTPETVHPWKPVEAFGCEACTFVRNLLQGEEVWLERDPAQPKDRYGRELACLHRVPDGLNVNAEIVRQGYGHAHPTYPHRYREQFRLLGVRARLLGKGLFAPAGPPAPSAPRLPASAPPAGPVGSMAPLVSPDAPPSASSPAARVAPTPPAQAEIVYVTPTGRKYHCATCRHLNGAGTPLPLAEARGRYGPCGGCKPPP